MYRGIILYTWATATGGDNKQATVHVTQLIGWHNFENSTIGKNSLPCNCITVSLDLSYNIAIQIDAYLYTVGESYVVVKL